MKRPAGAGGLGEWDVRRNLLLTGVAMVLGGAMAGLTGGAASAQSLTDALATAYSNNPTLLSQRASQRATDEGVPQALSGWRPTVTFTSSAGKLDQDFQPGSATRRDDVISPFNNSISINQPLYRGSTSASVASAEALVQAGRATLTSTEETVLLNVVTAYMDVLQNQAVLELQRNNEQVLRRRLESTNAQFQVGELTRTDVAQAEASVSQAVADRITAEGTLDISRAAFQRAVGQAPANLVQPPALSDLPQTIEAALGIAMDENPDLQAAVFRQESSQNDIRSASGGLLPTVSLQATAGKAYETVSAKLITDTAQILAVVSVPLYESGSVYSQTRQRRQIDSQRRVQIDETRRLVQQNVTQFWSSLGSARANIRSRKDQVESTRVALDGVQQEQMVGSRTVLDVLNADQAYLNAQVALVRSQHDEYVAAFQLQSAIGRLTARRLGLPVELYDPVANYNRVRDKWIGTDGGLN